MEIVTGNSNIGKSINLGRLHNIFIKWFIFNGLNNDIFRKTKLVLETFNWISEIYVKFKDDNINNNL